MRSFLKQHRLYILLSLLCTCLLLYPYLIRDFLAVEHDTFFHLSRIEGMASSIRQGDFLPALYPAKNNGFGYASPSFYCDILLIPSALLYIAGISLASSYKSAVFVFTFLSLFHTALFAERCAKSRKAACIAAAASAFANYRITNIYVRGALGEIAAMAFLPLLLWGLYEVLYAKEYGRRGLIAAGLAGLIFSHNLSFLFGALLTVLFFMIRIRTLDKEAWKALFEAVFAAFLLTVFFTLPMIEQLLSQKFYLSVTGSDLSSYTIKPWMYLVNKTVFGYGNNTYAADQIMTVNPGWFLTAAPLLYFAVRKKDSYIRDAMILGYICLLLPCSLVPWQYMSFASVIQFPWRLVMVSVPLLCIPASYAVSSLTKGKMLSVFCVLVLSAEGLYHVRPALTRTFGITSATTYEQMIDGTVIDPYYSAFYVRVELAGADYLPVGSPDFRIRTPQVYGDGAPLSLEIRRFGSAMMFTTEQSYDTLELPLTWYKGYSVWRIDASGTYHTVVCGPSANRLVEVRTAEKGQYMCMVQNTAVRIFSRHASMLALVYFLLKKFMPDNPLLKIIPRPASK